MSDKDNHDDNFLGLNNMHKSLTDPLGINKLLKDHPKVAHLHQQSELSKAILGMQASIGQNSMHKSPTDSMGINKLLKDHPKVALLHDSLRVNNSILGMQESVATWKDKMGMNSIIPQMSSGVGQVMAGIQESMDRWQNNLGVNSIFSQMQNLNEKWESIFGLSKMHEAVFKNMGIHRAIYEPNFGNYTSTHNWIENLNKFNVPDSIFSKISSINSNLEGLLGNFSSSIHWAGVGLASSRAMNLQFAFDNVAGKIASVAASTRQWDLLNDLETLSADATTISSELSLEEVASDEIRLKLRILIERIANLPKKYKNAGHAVFLLLSLIGLFMQYYDFFKSKPEYATQNEVNEVNNRLDFLTTYIKDTKQYRTLMRKCNILLKPNLKAQTVAVLPKFFEVVVLSENSKWLFVSYIDPNEDLPETGWVLKKYVSSFRLVPQKPVKTINRTAKARKQLK